VTFNEAKSLAEKTALDLSDAFQVLSVKAGFFSPLVGDSATILVTADKRLAQAATGEGVRAWYCLEDPAP
jgi:predicted nucleic acid-binding protein